MCVRFLSNALSFFTFRFRYDRFVRYALIGNRLRIIASRLIDFAFVVLNVGFSRRGIICAFGNQSLITRNRRRFFSAFIFTFSRVRSFNPAVCRSAFRIFFRGKKRLTLGDNGRSRYRFVELAAPLCDLYDDVRIFYNAEFRGRFR